MGATTPGRTEIAEIRRYLLGQLTQEEEEQVELRLITDAGYTEELDMVVDQITDEYVANVLVGEELRLVESYFLQSQERREKLKFVRALRDYEANIVLTPQASTDEMIVASHRRASEMAVEARSTQIKSPTLLPSITISWLFRAAAVLAAVGLLVTVFSLWRSRNTPPQYLAVTMNLTAGDRGNEAVPATKINFPQKVDVLRVSLVLPEGLRPEANYRVRLVSGNGETTSLNITGREGQSIVVDIPRSELKIGSYALKLFNIGADGLEISIPGSYLFVIE